MDLYTKILNIVTDRVYISKSKLQTISESTYQIEAINFLYETKTKCDIVKIGLDKPQWGKSLVNKYIVILKNDKHKYTFDFYDSIVNTEKYKNALLDFYSVLSCLNFTTPESFDDFCLDFGYEFKNESEYIKVKATHLACLDQDKNLKKLFTSDELSRFSHY